MFSIFIVLSSFLHFFSHFLFFQDNEGVLVPVVLTSRTLQFLRLCAVYLLDELQCLAVAWRQKVSTYGRATLHVRKLNFENRNFFVKF